MSKGTLPKPHFTSGEEETYVHSQHLKAILISLISFVLCWVSVDPGIISRGLLDKCSYAKCVKSILIDVNSLSSVVYYKALFKQESEHDSWFHLTSRSGQKSRAKSF